MWLSVGGTPLRRFFEGKRVKVSLFLSEGIQLPSGKLVLPSCRRDQVGLVRSFGGSGQLEAEERLSLASQQVSISHNPRSSNQQRRLS